VHVLGRNASPTSRGRSPDRHTDRVYSLQSGDLEEECSGWDRHQSRFWRGRTGARGCGGRIVALRGGRWECGGRKQRRVGGRGAQKRRLGRNGENVHEKMSVLSRPPSKRVAVRSYLLCPSDANKGPALAQLRLAGLPAKESLSGSRYIMCTWDLRKVQEFAKLKFQHRAQDFPGLHPTYHTACHTHDVTGSRLPMTSFTTCLGQPCPSSPQHTQHYDCSAPPSRSAHCPS